MKHQPARGRTDRMLAHSCKLLSIAAVTACSFLPSGAYAQPYNSQLYEFTATPTFPTTPPLPVMSNVHGFATKVLRSATNSESVMAGTMYANNTDANFPSGTNITYPMFMHLKDYSGTPDYPEINMPDYTVYDITNSPSGYFYGNKTVDVVEDAASNFFIITAAREIAIPNPARDCINLIQVDVSGNVLGAVTISDPTITGHCGWGLYPINGLYHVDKNAKDVLYICGYVVTEPRCGVPVGGSGWSIPLGWDMTPDFHTPKKAFVMAIDISGGTIGGVLNCKYYDYVQTGGVVNNPEFDFDIAMRLTELSANYANHGGQIHVTGSVNAQTGSDNGSMPTNGTIMRSATMNMVIDDVTLNQLEVGHFISAGNGDGFGTSEYGVAFEENSHSSVNGDHYIVSNIYKGLPTSGGTGYDTWFNNTSDGLNLQPERFAITHVPPGLQATNNLPGVLSTRAVCDQEGWAIQTLPSGNLTAFFPVNFSEKRFLIAGLFSDTTGVGTGEKKIVPFIYDMGARFSMSSVTTGNMALGLNQTEVTDKTYFDNGSSTGDPLGGATQPVNSYFMPWQDYSNINFGPRFASRKTIGATLTEPIVLNAAKLDGGSGITAGPILGLKAMFADGDAANSGAGYTSVSWAICRFEKNPGFYLDDVQNFDDGVAPVFCSTSTPSLNILPITVNTIATTVTKLGECAYGTYKTTGIKIIKASKTIISPNPATTSIKVVLSSAVQDNANVKVVLSNMHGQIVKELYNGEALAIGNTSLSLPQVATGLYIVQVYSNGAMVHQQKLSIQQ